MENKESFMDNMAKFYIITILWRKNTHGYELMHEIQKFTGKKPSPGQIYPTMKLLEKNKIVTSKKILHGKRKKKVYSLTAEGKAIAADLMKKFSHLIEASIRSKLSKCCHCGCEIYGKGFINISGNVKRTFCCKSCWQSFMRR